MQINTTRKTKRYQSGDEVTAQIAECKDVNGNFGVKFYILESGKMGQSFFYHSFGAYQGKGVYYFEQFLDHLKVPEGINIDEKWFIGKRVQVILGERQSPTDKRFYLNIASYVNVAESVETPIDPFGHNNDLTQDVPFDTDSDNAATPAPKVNKRKKSTPGETAIDQRPDYTTLLNE